MIVMIKASIYEDQTRHSRLDAAMLALGFKWNGEDAYEKFAPVKHTATVTSPQNRARRRGRNRPDWPVELYEETEALNRGESMDLTQAMRDAGINKKHAAARIYSHFYKTNAHKNHRFSLVESARGVFTLTRL